MVRARTQKILLDSSGSSSFSRVELQFSILFDTLQVDMCQESQYCI